MAEDLRDKDIFFDECLRIERDEIGLVPVDALVVGRVESTRFLPAQALTYFLVARPDDGLRLGRFCGVFSNARARVRPWAARSAESGAMRFLQPAEATNVRIYLTPGL